MTNIENNLKANDLNIKLGSCIQLETYSEFFDILLSNYCDFIKANSCFLNNFPLDDFLCVLGNFKDDLSFFNTCIEKTLEGGSFDTCDYVLKYNT